MNALIACSFSVLLSASAMAAERAAPIHLSPSPGAPALSVSGEIHGEQIALYQFQGRAGQRVALELATANSANYFDLYAPGRGVVDKAFYTGSINGPRFEGSLPADGLYSVELYLKRGAAHRGERAKFRLSLELKP